MSRKYTFTALAVALGLVAGACSEQPIPTATDNATTAIVPSVFNSDNAPPASGPFLVRGQTGFAVFYVDFEDGMLVVLGIDIVQFCTSGAPFDIVAFQNISVPEDANRVNQLIHGDDLTTSVWPLFGFNCGLFTSTAPLASGTSDLISTDNDIFIFNNPDSRNANAFGFRAHGQLTDPSGRRRMFSGHCNVSWDGNDFSRFFFQDKITLSR
ncbi:MAG: hypothetical protein O7E49_14355 [Gemmatimonadetes bacterium]|nr:hypothetical protein [Gemmatimonadota bacterium]